MNAVDAINPSCPDSRVKLHLEALAQFGELHDATTCESSERMCNITPLMAEFVSHFIKDNDIKNILELGASNGYATIWLAQAAKEIGGQVTSVEVNPSKTRMALENLSHAGLEYWVKLHQEDARNFLAMPPADSYGLIFMDIPVDNLPTWLAALSRILRDDGYLVINGIPLDSAEQKDLFDNIGAGTDLSLFSVLSDRGRTMAVWDKKAD